jgi:hypothetical protein
VRRNVEALGDVAAGDRVFTGTPASGECHNQEICSTDDLVADDDVLALDDVRAQGNVIAVGDVIAVDAVKTGSPASTDCVGPDVCSFDDLVADDDVYAGDDIFAGGIKSAVILTASYGERLTVAVEGAQVWLVDQGRDQLKGGVATIALDPIFAEMIAVDTLLVQVTLTGPASGVWVEQNRKGFTVRELQGGHSDATFNWQVSAVRIGYEKWRLDQSPVVKGSEEREINSD